MSVEDYYQRKKEEFTKLKSEYEKIFQEYKTKEGNINQILQKLAGLKSHLKWNNCLEAITYLVSQKENKVYNEYKKKIFLPIIEANNQADSVKYHNLELIFLIEKDNKSKAISEINTNFLSVALEGSVANWLNHVLKYDGKYYIPLILNKSGELIFSDDIISFQRDAILNLSTILKNENPRNLNFIISENYEYLLDYIEMILTEQLNKVDYLSLEEMTKLADNYLKNRPQPNSVPKKKVKRKEEFDEFS